MTKKILIRTFIVLFGLIAVTLVGALIFADDGNPTDELHAAAREFRSKPTEYHLRRLLNIEADASYSFLQMALVGRAFGKRSTEPLYPTPARFR